MANARHCIFVLVVAAALTSCARGSSTSGLPSASVSGHTVAQEQMTVTLMRTTAGQAQKRTPLMIPAAANSVDVRVEVQSNPTAILNSTCSPLSPGQSSVTLTLSVPQDHDVLTITSFSGPCSPVAGGQGALGSGNPLSQFSGSGTVDGTTTSANAVFNGGNPFVLGEFLPFFTDVNPTQTLSTIGPRGLYGVSGKLQGVAVVSGPPNTIYVSGGQGFGDGEVVSSAGIYASSDSGRTWVKRDNGLTDPSVNTLWLDQNHPANMIAGTSFAGIFHSTDGAMSWSNVSAHPAVTQILQAGSTLFATSADGILSSADDGATWSVFLATTSPAISMAATTAGIAYVGLFDGTILSVSGNTATVSTKLAGSVHNIAVEQGNTSTAFASIRGDDTHVMRTLDGGTHWTAIAILGGVTQLPGAFYTTQILATDPLQTHVVYEAVTDAQMYQSVDDGNTWTPAGYSGDLRSLSFVNTGSSTQDEYVGSDEGFAHCTLTLAHCSAITASLSVNVAASVAVSGSTVATTLQDFGPTVSPDGGLTWPNPVPATFEDGLAAINPGNAGTCYIFDGSGFHISTDGGRTFSLVTSIAVTGGFAYWTIGPHIIATDAKTPLNVYATVAGGLAVSRDGGHTFAPFASPLTKGYGVAVDPSSSLHILAWDDQSLYVTLDGGVSWTKAALGSQLFNLTLAISPADGDVILASNGFANAGSQTILRSTNGGLSFSPISSVSLTQAGAIRQPAPAVLEAIRRKSAPIGKLLTLSSGGSVGFVHNLSFDDHGAPPYAALSTTVGMFVSTDYGLHWHKMSGSTANIFDFASWSAGVLFGATGGEGVVKSSAPLQ